MNRVGLLCLFIGLLAITCANAQYLRGGGKCKDKYDEDKCIKMMEAGKCEDKKVAKKCMKTCGECDDDDGGEGGKCKDKMDNKKCKKMMEAGKCEDEKVAKKCMKTCDMCEDMGPKKTPFELIDENGDGNITRDEWQMKIEKAMDKVMYITNVTLDEDLYDDIWEAMDCNNATTIDMEDWEMLLDGENQCGDELDLVSSCLQHSCFRHSNCVFKIQGCSSCLKPDMFMQFFKESINTLSCEFFAHRVKYIL